MTIVHTNGKNKDFYKDFYKLCKRLDKSLNENVPTRKEAGVNSLYNVENIKDIFMLYDDESNAIGSACLWQHDDTHCEVIRVFVDEDHRGRGLAGILVGEVERLAKSKGYKSIMLRTWSCTPYSIRAYTKLGFSPVPASKIKYTDKFSPALALSNLRVYMKKDLI